MLLRALASIGFLGGGALTCVAFWWLGKLTKFQAGMGDGTISVAPSAATAEAVFTVLLIGYFLVSAMTVLICKTKSSLRIAAAVAHSIILIAILVISYPEFEGRNPGFDDHDWANSSRLSSAPSPYLACGSFPGLSFGSSFCPKHCQTQANLNLQNSTRIRKSFPDDAAPHGAQSYFLGVGFYKHAAPPVLLNLICEICAICG